MTTRLLLVRHGDSRHKAEGITGGPKSCRGLTDLGRAQAARLRDRLRRDPAARGIAAVYCSPLPRAVETAAALAGSFPDVPVREDAGLRSWVVPPEGDGMAVADYQREYAQPGGGVFRPFETCSESWAGLVGRVGRALTEIAQRHAGETVLIVTHAEPVVASLIVLGGLPLCPPFDVKAANTSLTEWTTDGDPAAWPPARWSLVRLNDGAHLEEI